MVTPAIGVALVFVAVAAKVLVVARGSLPTAEEIVSISNQWTIISGTLLIFFQDVVTAINLIAQVALTITGMNYIRHRTMTRWAWERLALEAAAFIISLLLTVAVTPFFNVVLLVAYLFGNGAWLYTFAHSKHLVKLPKPPRPVSTLYLGAFGVIVGESCLLLALSTPWLAPQAIILNSDFGHKPFTAYVLQDTNGQVTLLLGASRTILSVDQSDVRMEQLCQLSDKDITQGRSLLQLLGSASGPQLPTCPSGTP